MSSIASRAALAVTAVLLSLPAPATATWSIVAVDTRTGLVVIASATCVTADGLRSRGGLKSIQAIIVPGVGVAAAQAGVDRTRANQMLIYEQIRAGTDPAGIYFAVQGNILESDAVVLDAVAAFLAEEGTVVDRVMAPMEAADVAGGDSRYSCRTDPVPETDVGCRHRTAHVAYITAARAEDSVGTGHSDGEYSLFIDVDDENTTTAESANPVETLRMRYDAWKAAGGLGELGLR